MTRVIHLAVAIAVVAACGGKKGDKAKQDAAGPAVASLAIPPIGIDAIKRINYVGGDGQPYYDKAFAAYNKKPRDWSAVRTYCEAAVARDPHHLDAHRVLASALAQAGEHAAAVDHLVAALASDYLKYGPTLATDPDLKDFLAGTHGAAIVELAARIRAEYTKRIATGVWLVARRGGYYWPRKEGVQSSWSRGEVYAFDRETRRYFRLTHTEHQVAGFVRSSSGTEIATFGFEKIDRTFPKTDKDAPVPPVEPPPPTIVKSWLQVNDTTEWKLIGKPVALLPNLRTISAGYSEGDRLLVQMAPLAGAATTSAVDKTTAKLSKVDVATFVPRIDFSLDEGVLSNDGKGITPTLANPTVATSFRTSAGGTVRVPESGQVLVTSIVSSPDQSRVAFPTLVDPCAKDAASSLYVADAKTGALKHLLTGRSRFAARWVNPSTLAYEDGEGAIRLWDATTGREVMRLENKPGIALAVLSLQPAPICKQAPPTTDPAVGSGSGSDEEPPPLPPEEGSAGGPVTRPQ